MTWFGGVSWKADLLPWLPPVFTLIGWYIVNQQNNQRETRKDLRAAADRCKALARDVAQLGFKYWAGQDNVKTWQIKAGLEELEVELDRFPEAKGGADLMSCYVDFVEAIAGYDFESATFYSKAADHPVFRQVSSTRQRLLAEIEFQFKKHHS